MAASTNKIPNNVFVNGLTVSGGLVADSLIVNGASITTGSGVTTSTDINNNSTSLVPTTSVTYQLKQKNDTQDTSIATINNSLATVNTDIGNLKLGLDAIYNGTSGAWVGLGALAFATGSQFLPKAGGTMTGDLALGTNSITTVKDVKSSNAVMTGNVYCSNVICAAGSKYYGDGSSLNLDNVERIGVDVLDTVEIGNAGGFVNILGEIGADIKFGGPYDIVNVRNVKTSNALMTGNVYCSNVICAAGSKFYGDGSALTGIAGGTDATSSLNIGTVPTSGNMNIGTNLPPASTIRIGNASTASAAQVIINGGGTNGVYMTAGTSGVNVNATGGGVNIGTGYQVPVNIGYNVATATQPINLNASYIQATLPHSISPTATHSQALTRGFIQTCVIPLSPEQGPVSQTSGSGVLPTVLFRTPFQWSVYGMRLSCLQASTSGPVTVDVRAYSDQAIVISGTTVNSTTGTSLFGAGRLNIDALKYSSVGSTGVANNGVLVSNPVVVLDDLVVGVYITSPGVNVMGLKLCIYYTC